MKTEIYLNDLDYSKLKQATDFTLCYRTNHHTFGSYYHNVSYFVPNELISDEWSVINFCAKLLAHDLAN